MKSLHPPHHRKQKKTFLLLQTNEPDWWLNPQTHLETHKGKIDGKRKETESKMRQLERKKTGSWSESSGSISDVFAGLGWCGKVTWKRATRSERGVRLPSQPLAFTHEPWTMKRNKTFSSRSFLFLERQNKLQKKTRQGDARKKNRTWKTPIFSLFAIFTTLFSESRLWENRKYSNY